MKVTLEKISLEIDQNNCTAKISISPQAHGNVVIPRVLKYQSKEYQIIGINSDAFKNNVHIEEIVFPKDSLVQTINKFAFSGTNIQTMILPASLERICEGAFSDCKMLRKISFDDGSKLKSISKDAFAWSALQSLSLPANVHLKEGWCNGTSNLTQISVSSDSKTLSCIGTDFIVGKSKPNLNDYDLLYFARRDIENAVIPSSIKRICSFAFLNCQQLTSIQFSDDSQLKNIDQYAFSWASLIKVSIPDHVKKIHQFAFSECPKLQTVEFSDTSKLQCIKEYAFSSSTLESIKIPAHVNQIGKHAFSWCKQLKDVTFSENSELSSFEKNVFHQTSIETINIPSQIQLICEGAFSQCKSLKAVNFPNDSKLKSIEVNAFAGSSLEKIVMPPSLEHLKDGWCCGTTNAFNVEIASANQNFKSVKNDLVIEKSEDKGTDYDAIVFARKDMENAIIPSQIKEIVPYAFDQCQKLMSVVSEQPKVPINTELPPIPSPSNSTSDDNNNEEEKDENNKIVLPQQIDNNAFRNCSKLESVELIGDEVCVGGQVFSECKNLQIVSFPNACILSVSEDSFNNVPHSFAIFVKAGTELVNN